MKNKKVIIICFVMATIAILCSIFLVAYKNTEISNKKGIIGNKIIEPDRIVYRNSDGEYFEFLKGEDSYEKIKNLLQKSITTYKEDGTKLSDNEIEQIHNKICIEFDYKTASKNYIIQLEDNNKQAVIKLADEGGKVYTEKISNVRKIKKLLENLTQDLSPHILEYKAMLSRNKLDTMEYKYLQLFKEINYKIHQVKIDSFADYEKFKTICNLAFDENITEDTFKNNIGILTVSLVPKIDVKVNIGNIKYTYDKLENVNYGYNAHLLIVDKIVNTDCIYNTDLTEISSKVEYDNMKVSYDEEVDNLDKNIFMIDFNSFLNEYKSTNTTISKDEATRNCRKRF